MAGMREPVTPVISRVPFAYAALAAKVRDVLDLPGDG